MDSLKDALDRALPTLQRAASRALPAERITSTVIAAASRNPQLLDCTMTSIVQGAMMGAELGLQFTGPLGEAYLIPRKNGTTKKLEACFQLGYRGKMTLVRRSGTVGSINVFLVFRGEQFDVKFGLDPSITHVPDFKLRCIVKDAAAAAQRLVAGYAVARFKDGSVQFEVMPLEMVEEHRRKYSKAGDLSPWNSRYDRMMEKTLLGALCNRLPTSSEAARAMAYSDSAERGEMVDPAEFGFGSGGDAIDVDAETVDDDVDPETGEVIPPGVGVGGSGTAALKGSLR